ncbi:restriction endonuclease [Neobacillus cucumis]|uniref:restriction endonuclease n=1 Tax=Neobacillus cucumis TaxID=1740721 RepID=UPI002041B177|nr:restriction endonuclease [Neobacillus cucumis]MCM3725092.1 restriction endonuclease [Neobacillus cucumis]
MEGNVIEPFQTEEFLKIKQSLIERGENYLDFGRLRKGEYYLLLVDDLGLLINKKLEVALESPLNSFIYKHSGFSSFELKIGEDFSYKLLLHEKDLIINYLFNTGPFIRSKQSFISKHKFTYLDYGPIKRDTGKYYYLLIVDNKGYLFDQDMNITSTTTDFIFRGGPDLWKFQIEIKGYYYTFEMDTEQKKKFDDFKNSLTHYELSFLMEMDRYKTILLTNHKVKTLLTNFLEQQFKTTFKDGTLFEVYDDDFLVSTFHRAKKLRSHITESFKVDLESYYQKILDILFNWNALEREVIGEHGFLILNRSLRDIAVDYYAKEFEELYGGYFSSIDMVDIENYIDSYYTIDFIDHDDEDNIGFFTYYLLYKSKDFQISTMNSLVEANKILSERIAEYEKNKELKSFEYSLMNSKKVKPINGFENVSIDDVDMMNGVEFEEFICYLFKKMGYTVNLTPASGDQGIDLVAVKNGLRIGIQTKRYSNSVSNKAIQEVVAGVKHYNLSKAIVITNNFFTKSAIDLAISNDVVLWDRSILKEKILDLAIGNAQL